MIRVESTPEFVAAAYLKMEERIAVARTKLGRPLSLS
jgi:hypothetical protein